MNKNNTLYVLQLSSGSYDDWHTWIEAIFTDESLAKEALGEWLKAVDRVRTRYTPEEIAKYEKIWDEDQWTDTPYAEDVIEYQRWSCHPVLSMNEDSFKIIPYEANVVTYEYKF